MNTLKNLPPRPLLRRRDPTPARSRELSQGAPSSAPRDQTARFEELYAALKEGKNPLPPALQRQAKEMTFLFVDGLLGDQLKGRRILGHRIPGYFDDAREAVKKLA